MGSLQISMSSFLNKAKATSPRLDSTASNDDEESLLRGATRDGIFIKPQSLMRPLRRRTIFYLLGAVFLLLTFSSFMYKTRIRGVGIPAVVETNPKVDNKVGPLDGRLSVVRGPPTAKFRGLGS